MKRKHLLSQTILLVLLAVAFVSYKKDEVLSVQEQVEIQLTSAEVWEDPVVTVDGVAQSEVYKNFNIAFSKRTYKTTSGAPIWNSSGTWAFINEEATLMLFDGVTEVEIKLLSDEILQLSLLWEENTFEPGRSRSLNGKNVFKLKKKKKV